jgi:hypothetical protein
MLWLNLKHLCAGATLDADGVLIAPTAPILKGWIGRHYRVVIAYYTKRGSFIEAKII